MGLGNWGFSLLSACQKAKLPVGEVIRRRRGRVLGRASILLAEAKLDAEILWLCVPDRMIAEVCERIAAQRKDLSGQMVLHSSGALSSKVLESVREAGAEVASVHPLMSFPSHRPVSLKGVPFAVEARSKSMYRRLALLTEALGGEPFALGMEAKTLYHASGTLASPLLLSTIAAAEQAIVSAGVAPRKARELVGRIALATVSNYLAQGAAKSVSGPFARGDFQTIALHLRAMEEHPSLASLYRELACYALERLPSRNQQQIKSLLAVPSKGSSA